MILFRKEIMKGFTNSFTVDYSILRKAFLFRYFLNANLFDYIKKSWSVVHVVMFVGECVLLDSSDSSSDLLVQTAFLVFESYFLEAFRSFALCYWRSSSITAPASSSVHDFGLTVQAGGCGLQCALYPGTLLFRPILL